jgi:hypothetical protein
MRLLKAKVLCMNQARYQTLRELLDAQRAYSCEPREDVKVFG